MWICFIASGPAESVPRINGVSTRIRGGAGCQQQAACKGVLSRCRPISSAIRLRSRRSIRRRNPVLNTYWTMASVRHGDYVAKARIAPAADSVEKAIHHHLDLKSGPDVFGPTLAEELRAHAFDFDLQVQLCTDLTAMPVNDATVEWPEKLSPFVTVGRVHLPCQDISRPEDFEKGDALAFNQWRVISDHRPLGEIMDAPEDDRGSRRRAGHEP